jgi:hypothetical protein
MVHCKNWWSSGVKVFLFLLVALNVYCRYFKVIAFCISFTDNCAYLKKRLSVHVVKRVYELKAKGQLMRILANALLLYLGVFSVLITFLFFCALPLP